MSDTHALVKQAQDALAAAQRKLAALQAVPDADIYEEGTVLRWKMERGAWRAAVKNAPRNWTVSNYAQVLSWETLVSVFLSNTLEVFEMAPEDWSDARVQPEPTPPIEVSSDGYTLTDTHTGHTWRRDGDRWLLTR